MEELYSLRLAKICTCIFLFLVSILMGILPHKWDKFQKNPKLISFANSFAAGLFLSVGVFHVLPEAVAEYAKYRVQGGHKYKGFPEDTFPMAFFCAVLGYSGILLLDKVVLRSHEMIEHEHNQTALAEVDHDGESQNILNSDQNSEISNIIESQQSSPLDSKHEKAMINYPSKENTAVTNDFAPENLRKKERHSHKHQQNKDFSPFIIMVALSIHATLEGIAIGLEKNLSSTIDLCIAVSIHKWIEALTLGISLMKANVSLNILYILLFVFGIASPLGVAIGWIMLEAPLIISAIFKSIATGTFLYLSATEITSEEFSQKRHRVAKYLYFMGGVTFVTFATYLE